MSGEKLGWIGRSLGSKPNSGGVAPAGSNFHGDRMDELGALVDNSGKTDLTGATTDWYGEGDSVSIEEAVTKEFEIKDALDDALDDENRYGSNPGRRFSGQPPCIFARNRRNKQT